MISVAMLHLVFMIVLVAICYMLCYSHEEESSKCPVCMKVRFQSYMCNYSCKPIGVAMV